MTPQGFDTAIDRFAATVPRGEALDKTGDVYGVQRRPGEDDDAFHVRLRNAVMAVEKIAAKRARRAKDTQAPTAATRVDVAVDGWPLIARPNRNATT